MYSGQPIPFPTPEEARDYPYNEREKAILESISRRSIVGTPQQVRENLTEIAERHQAEELVIVTITYDFASRLRSYELIAKEFGLTARD
jgi:alkanesulfonate monooxygenase SsuD/methylene tetrahydromethanopterin reductase-like flavin-dependent oxidoreductase (luciferase family)